MTGRELTSDDIAVFHATSGWSVTWKTEDIRHLRTWGHSTWDRRKARQFGRQLELETAETKLGLTR